MKAIDINRHFLSLADWVDPKTTVDKVIIGDPNTDVNSILVTWISSFDALKTTVKGRFDMLVTHEPTFYVHDRELERESLWASESNIKDIALKKKQYIEDNGLVILRNHDVWDRMPNIGIPWAWAQFLGFGKSPAVTELGGCQHRYDIKPISLKELAQQIVKKLEFLGEKFVEVVGDGDHIVSKVGIGTGCICNIDVFQSMGCDVSIVCDDGTSYWSDIQFAADNGHSVICVNHGTSEEPGMLTMTEYINDNISGVKAIHLPHGSSFKLIGAS